MKRPKKKTLKEKKKLVIPNMQNWIMGVNASGNEIIICKKTGFFRKVGEFEAKVLRKAMAL